MREEYDQLTGAISRRGPIRQNQPNTFFRGRDVKIDEELLEVA
ncbi:MAG: hypothetical protein ACTSXS_02720 [Candidatus Thorarchaeota archaeon]